MSLTITIDSPPMTVDPTGTVRIGGTRVTLDTLIEAFRAGNTADQIAEQFTAVTLADIYAVISYYLRHRDSVDEYLAGRQRKATETRQVIETEHPPIGRRQTLESRLPRSEPAS